MLRHMLTGMEAGPDWLLVTVSTGQVASLRVYVWRQLRKLGAVYLQQSVSLLSDRSDVANTIARLVARVRDQGGQARILRVRLTDPQEHEDLVAEQRAERDAEYAEVEESVADLERFEKWLAAIAARDYFDAPGGAAARAAVQQCRHALADLATPFDLVPDCIPILGYADDAIIVTAVLRGVVRRAGLNAVERHWPGAQDGFAALCRLTGITSAERPQVADEAPDA
jgi:uncharacterized membrane protein YkvA (DUF1232 family)